MKHPETVTTISKVMQEFLQTNNFPKSNGNKINKRNSLNKNPEEMPFLGAKHETFKILL
jgi:hypothetical protein